jgi:hypothetical protein
VRKGQPDSAGDGAGFQTTEQGDGLLVLKAVLLAKVGAGQVEAVGGAVRLAQAEG